MTPAAPDSHRFPFFATGVTCSDCAFGPVAIVVVRKSDPIIASTESRLTSSFVIGFASSPVAIFLGPFSCKLVKSEKMTGPTFGLSRRRNEQEAFDTPRRTYGMNTVYVGPYDVVSQMDGPRSIVEVELAQRLCLFLNRSLVVEKINSDVSFDHEGRRRLARKEHDLAHKSLTRCDPVGIASLTRRPQADNL